MDTTIASAANAGGVVPPPLLINTPAAATLTALPRSSAPLLPLPIAAGHGQIGAVVQAKIATATDPVGAVERVLKPYGVVMLPQGPTKDGPIPLADDAAVRAGAERKSVQPDAPNGQPGRPPSQAWATPLDPPLASL